MTSWTRWSGAEAPAVRPTVVTPVSQSLWMSAAESIRGKVAGARVIRGEGTPGEGTVVVILRGATSISTVGRSNQPLYVVDGVILGSSMVDIDALNIESIEVVKGASAAALYGARAANGVVSITTHRGRDIPEAEALERIAILNGIAPKARSWRHSSIASRAAFLRALADDPARVQRFQRMVWSIKAFLAVGICIALPLTAYLYWMDRLPRQLLGF